MDYLVVVSRDECREVGCVPRSCDCLFPCLAHRVAQVELLRFPCGLPIAVRSLVRRRLRRLPRNVSWWGSSCFGLFRCHLTACVKSALAARVLEKQRRPVSLIVSLNARADISAEKNK